MSSHCPPFIPRHGVLSLLFLVLSLTLTCTTVSARLRDLVHDPTIQTTSYLKRGAVPPKIEEERLPVLIDERDIAEIDRYQGQTPCPDLSPKPSQFIHPRPRQPADQFQVCAKRPMMDRDFQHPASPTRKAGQRTNRSKQTC